MGTGGSAQIMRIINIIKKRKSIRKYLNKPIPKKALDLIVEAGVWGPSVPSFLRVQPWKFVVTSNKKITRKIFQVLSEKAKHSGAGVNILVGSAANMVQNCTIMIAVYNSGDMDKLKKKYKVVYSKFKDIIKKAELSAISAAIQNMLLVAEELGIGTCWLDTPLFCEKEINRILKQNKHLVAILTLGFPAEPGRRAPRKPAKEALQIIK
jgi:nitroreductase